MKITEKQLMILHQTTVDSLKIADRAGVFTYGEETRRAICNEVLNQQNRMIYSSEDAAGANSGKAR